MSRRWFIVLLVGAVLVAGIPVAAQEEAEIPPVFDPVPPDEVTGPWRIDDGEYSGSIGFGGAFWLDIDGAAIIWSGSARGPMSFTVTNGVLEGVWSFDGSADISSIGLPFPLSGVNTFSGGGGVSGDGTYRLSGGGTTSSTASVAGFTQSVSESWDATDVPLQGIVQVCDQVVGNWDQMIDSAMADTTLTYSMRSYFSVFALVPSDEIHERIDEVLEQANEIRNDQRDPSLVIFRLGLLMDDIEALLSDMDAHPETCPIDGTFLRITTQVVADLANTFMAQWEGEEPHPLQAIDLRDLLAVALRAGAIGSGAADPATAEFLESRAEALVQRAYDDALTHDPISDEQLLAAAVAAQMLGYTFQPSGLTGEEICSVLGSC